MDSFFPNPFQCVVLPCLITVILTGVRWSHNLPQWSGMLDSHSAAWCSSLGSIHTGLVLFPEASSSAILHILVAPESVVTISGWYPSSTHTSEYLFIPVDYPHFINLYNMWAHGIRRKYESSMAVYICNTSACGGGRRRGVYILRTHCRKQKDWNEVSLWTRQDSSRETASEGRGSAFKSWTDNGVTLNSHPASSRRGSPVSETGLWS